MKGGKVFIEIAGLFEGDLEQLANTHGCTTVEDARRLAEQEKLPIKIKYLGYHEKSTLPIKRGDKVRIPKGTLVKRFGRKPLPSGRSQIVLVHHLLTGTSKSDWNTDDTTPIENPKVRWPGSGGYWCEADINEVEKIDE